MTCQAAWVEGKPSSWFARTDFESLSPMNTTSVTWKNNINALGLSFLICKVVLSGYWKNHVSCLVETPSTSLAMETAFQNLFDPLPVCIHTLSRCIQPANEILQPMKCFIIFVLKQPRGCPHLHQDRECCPKKPR